MAGLFRHPPQPQQRRLGVPAVAPVLSQVSYRGRNDDGNETTATWKAAESTPWTQPLDTNFRVRFEIQETAGAAHPAADVQLQRRLNGGTWGNVNASSTIARTFSSPNVTNNIATTDQLATGTGTFSNTAGVDTNNGQVGGVTTIPASGHTEYEFCLQLRSVEVVDTDVVEFRLEYGAASDRPGDLFDGPYVVLAHATAGTGAGAQTVGPLDALGTATTPEPQLNLRIFMTALGTASAATPDVLGPQAAGPLALLGGAALGSPQVNLRISLPALGTASSPAPSVVMIVSPALLGGATTPAPTVAAGLLTIGPFALLGGATTPAPQLNLRFSVAALGTAALATPTFRTSVVVAALGGATVPAPQLNQAVAFPVLGPAAVFDPTVAVAGSGVQPARLGGTTLPALVVAPGAVVVGPMAALGPAAVASPSLALRLSVALLGGAAVASPSIARSVAVAALGGAVTGAPIIVAGASTVGPMPRVGGASVPQPAIISGVGTGPGPSIISGGAGRPTIDGSRARPAIRSGRSRTPELV